MDMEENKVVQPDQYWSQPYQPKPLFELKKRDTAFAICAVVISVFSSIFGIFGGFALGYLLSVIGMLTLFGVYFAKQSKPRLLPTLCGLLSLANGAVFICTTNGSVRFFGVIVSFLLALVCFDGFINGNAKGNRQTLGVFYSAASTVGNAGVTIKSLFSNSNGDKKVIGKVLLGLICAIPVLIIVVPLLISSDEAFRGMMKNMFSDASGTIFKSVFGLLLAVFVISYGFSLGSGRFSKIKQGKFAGIENAYVISFLSAIGVFYVLYLFSQLAYFFSAFSGFLPDGEITYAQYARKGFFEMCVIAVINLGIVFLALLLAKKKNGKVCHGLKALATFIAVFTLIIIATAISKMILYIGVYGMTELRLTTSAFMVFLAVVFVSVILRIYTTRINVIKTALVTAGCIVLLLGTVNVNRVCAKYNYDSYRSGKLSGIDIEALYDLGDEGIPYIVKLADSENKEVSKTAKQYLATAYLYGYYEELGAMDSFTAEDLKKHEKNREFEYYSIPRAAAYESLFQYIRENPDFGQNCRKHLVGTATDSE